MSNFYTNQRYKEGLAGNKPGVFSDKEGYEAQMQGYQDYLRNKNLADQLADQLGERTREREQNDDYEAPPPPPPKPVTDWQRAKWSGAAIILLLLDFKIAMFMLRMITMDGRKYMAPGNEVIAFCAWFIIFPGGAFFLPAIILLINAITKKFT